MNKRDLRAHSHSSPSTNTDSSINYNSESNSVSGAYYSVVSDKISRKDNDISPNDNIYSSQLIKVKGISNLFTYNFYIDSNVFIKIIKNPKVPYILLTNFKERIMCTFINNNYTSLNISDDNEILQNIDNITDNLYCISLKKKYNNYIYSPYGIFILIAAMCILYSCIVSQESRQRRMLIRSMN